MENKKILLVILIVIIVMTIVSLNMNSKKNIKIYFSEDYVYTKDTYEHDEGFISELPYINIKNDNVMKINNDLINSYHITTKLKEEYMQYEYFINDNILSLIVKYYNLDSYDVYPNISIYNFDIKSGNVLSNNDLLNRLSVSEEVASSSIENGIRAYYDYERKQGYYTESFDSYLYDTASLPILDDCSYYITKEGLYAYKEVILDAEVFYDIDADFNLFHFIIK